MSLLYVAYKLGVLPSRPSSSDLVSWRYDIEKDVVEGKLVPVGGGVDEVMKERMLLHPKTSRSRPLKNCSNHSKMRIS